MARTFKEENYTSRRNEILDAAQKLIYTKGYELMTIQDILDELQISKGAFYHYFDSKPALLEALINRMMDTAVQILLPIVQDPDLPTLQKFHRFADAGMSWKASQKAFFMPLLRVWYADENIIVRQKIIGSGLKQMQPMLTEIIQQGVREGVFSTPMPGQVAEALLVLLQGMGDSLVTQLLAFEPGQTDMEAFRSTVLVYSSALERILGAPTGSLNLVDVEHLKEWLPLIPTAPPSAAA
jgi:AcrR family transcriptional regulator